MVSDIGTLAAAVQKYSGQLRQGHQYKNCEVELRGHTKTHIVKAGQTMNNNFHVYQVPILMLIIIYNSYHGNDTN